MKLFVLVLTFVATIGALLLIENFKNTPNNPDYARIIDALKKGDNYPPATPDILKNKTLTPSVVSTVPAAAPQNQSPILPPTTTSSSLPATPTPQPTSYSPTPVQYEATQEIQAQRASNHVYYTSSHYKAKYYYCDTDNEWKTLSEKYLRSFSSPEELLRSFPDRISHEPCK